MTATTHHSGLLVMALDTLGRGDLGTAGGKATGLGELIRGGFPVPPGFCVTTDAYQLAAEQAGLGTELEALGDHGAQLAEHAHSALRTVEVPDAVASAITAAYRGLGGGAVAVRSSATAEDLPTASFAGQQETYLNVVGEAALVDAVRRCWASLWTDRAISYRTANGIDHDGVRLAVVVQRMVDATAAGVLFTANPVTGARGEVVIDAGEGLGEAVVSGLVTPDRFVVAPHPTRITERRLGRRETVIRARPGGGTEEITTGDVAAAPALPARVVRTLARLGRRIERRAGTPQDVEWAWTGTELFVLQARPVTALPHPLKTGRIARLRDSMVREMMPIRPYPLDLAHIHAATHRVLPAMFGRFGVRIGLEGALVVDDGVVLRLRQTGPRPTLRTLTVPWIALWGDRKVDTAHWEDDALLHEGVARIRELESRDLANLDWAAVVAMVDEALDATVLFADLRARYLPRLVGEYALFFLLLTMTGRRRHAKALLSGVDNKTLRLNRALEALAVLVRATPALAEEFARASDPKTLLRRLEVLPAAAGFRDAFRAMLAEYGHRETAITVISQPTWRHAPEIPLGIITALASGEPSPEPGGPADWEQTRDRLLTRSVLGRVGLRRRFRRILTAARRLVRFREDTHFLFSTAWPIMRSCRLELGRRLVAAGVLDGPEDVFHLTAEELAGAGEPWPPLPAACQALRRAAYRRKARRATLGERFPADPRPTAPTAGTDAVLTGTPAGAGVAEGRARVIAGPAEFGALQSGEILVAPFTNPAWTPLFRRAAAVVVETGGVISHAAIVAREYGIPAVMGAADATRLLSTGDHIRVDGTTGVVSAVAPVGVAVSSEQAGARRTDVGPDRGR